MPICAMFYVDEYAGTRYVGDFIQEEFAIEEIQRLEGQAANLKKYRKENIVYIYFNPNSSAHYTILICEWS